MDQTHPYNGSLTAEQFLFYEIRIAAKYYVSGLKIDEAIERIKKDNLFQYPTERQVSRLARACYKRMDALGNEQQHPNENTFDFGDCRITPSGNRIILCLQSGKKRIHVFP